MRAREVPDCRGLWDAVLTGGTRTNANDVVILAVR